MMLPQRLTSKELNLIRQWYNAAKDTNPEYLTDTDAVLLGKVENIIAETELFNREFERLSMFTDSWLERFKVCSE